MVTWEAGLKARRQTNLTFYTWPISNIASSQRPLYLQITMCNADENASQDDAMSHTHTHTYHCSIDKRTGQNSSLLGLPRMEFLHTHEISVCLIGQTHHSFQRMTNFSYDLVELFQMTGIRAPRKRRDPTIVDSFDCQVQHSCETTYPTITSMILFEMANFEGLEPTHDNAHTRQCTAI